MTTPAVRKVSRSYAMKLAAQKDKEAAAVRDAAGKLEAFTGATLGMLMKATDVWYRLPGFPSWSYCWPLRRTAEVESWRLPLEQVRRVAEKAETKS